MPRVIGCLVSSKLATLVQLQTVLSCVDAHNLLEILAVDRDNERKMRPKS